MAGKEMKKSDSRKLSGSARYNVTSFMSIWNSVPVRENSINLVMNGFISDVKVRRKKQIESGEWVLDEDKFRAWVVSTAKNYIREGWPLKPHEFIRKTRVPRVSAMERMAVQYIQMLKDKSITPEEIRTMFYNAKSLAKKDKDKRLLVQRQDHIKGRIKSELGIDI